MHSFSSSSVATVRQAHRVLSKVEGQGVQAVGPEAHLDAVLNEHCALDQQLHDPRLLGREKLVLYLVEVDQEKETNGEGGIGASHYPSWYNICKSKPLTESVLYRLCKFPYAAGAIREYKQHEGTQFLDIVLQ